MTPKLIQEEIQNDPGSPTVTALDILEQEKQLENEASQLFNYKIDQCSLRIQSHFSKPRTDSPVQPWLCGSFARGNQGFI
jgi:hypothetical protein